MKTKRDYYELQASFIRFCEQNNIEQKKYFIQHSDARLGEASAIFEHTGTNGSINPITDFFTFDGLIAWMKGYTAANKLNLFK